MSAISKHELYPTWNAMRSRCYLMTNKDYKNYGGRGIKVCDEWKNNFQKFLADMGERPKGKTLERENNDLGYSKDNCVWATQSAQTKNQRRRSNARSDQELVEIFVSRMPVWFIVAKYKTDKKTVWEIKNFRYGEYSADVCRRYELDETGALRVKSSKAC